MSYTQFGLHKEKETYRLVVTTSGSTVHPVLGTFATKGCFPAPSTKTGTISTFTGGGQPGTYVLGVGTLFLSEFEVNDYIIDSNFVLRKILFIYSDTIMQIEAKFPSDLTGATVKKVRSAYSAFEVKSSGTGTAQLQEQDFPSGAVSINNGAPLSYDVSASNAGITFTIHL